MHAIGLGWQGMRLVRRVLQVRFTGGELQSVLGFPQFSWSCRVAEMVPYCVWRRSLHVTCSACVRTKMMVDIHNDTAYLVRRTYSQNALLEHNRLPRPRSRSPVSKIHPAQPFPMCNMAIPCYEYDLHHGDGMKFFSVGIGIPSSHPNAH